MSRIRTIKPEFWRHEELSELPEATHLLAASLLNYADDDGYFNANHKLIRAECCPLRELSVSIPDSLSHLCNIGYLKLGTAEDGKRYGKIVKFREHQKINRPTPSKIKAMAIVWDGSSLPHPQVMEPSLPEGKGKEGKGTIPPSQASGGTDDPIDDELEVPASLDRRAYPETFEVLWLAYRPVASPNATKADAHKAWFALAIAERDACLAGLKRYVSWLGEEKQKRDQTKVKHLATFIAKRGWEPFLEAAEPCEKDVAWIDQDDPRWRQITALWHEKRGGFPVAIGSRNESGLGVYVPATWLKEMATI